MTDSSRMGALLADKGLEPNAWLYWLGQRDIAVMTPPKANRKMQRSCDGYQLTSELMHQLGLVAKGRDCTAVIFSQLDFSKICTSLIHHIGQMQRQIRGNWLNY